MKMITIRPYKHEDLHHLITLFRDAVHAINSKHYSPQQIAVWIAIDESRWERSLQDNITFVAEINSEIVGFADMAHQGYLDHLYIHKNYQGRWVSVHLLRAIEKAACELKLSKITTHCSITAKKPAERMGFVVIREQTVEKNGTLFINYVMEKRLRFNE